MEKIDWNDWLKRRVLLEIEVALLTLGLDPENHQINYFVGERYLVDEGGLQALQKDFNRRITFIRDYRFRPYEYMADDGEWGDYFSANNDGVLVKRFLLWLKNEDMGWKLPTELQAYIEQLNNNPKALKVAVNSPEVIVGNAAKPWLVHNPSDPDPMQDWYTPARYFARELVANDVTLLTNRNRLAQKIAEALPKVNILKRGGKNPLDAETIKKALNIIFE